MKRLTKIKGVVAAYALLAVPASGLWAAEVEHPPAALTSRLSEASFAPVTVRQLAHPRDLWINRRGLWERGINPDLFQKRLDLEARFMIPQSSDAPQAFMNRFKTFFTDLYGGLGMNGNLGSGRAASFVDPELGPLQIKGVGRTPMVGPKVDDFVHSHGGASVLEGIIEASWAGLLNYELPLGANPVLAVVETGTFTQWQDRVGGLLKEPRALIFREDPLRPAHFVSNPSVEGETAQARDSLRIQNALARLPYDLAESEKLEVQNFSSTQALLAEGLVAWEKRVASQYAAAYARKLYHGATSPSNIELSARALDFGTQTAINGYTQILTLEDEAPFGDESVFLRDLIQPVFANLREHLPTELKSSVPSNSQAMQIFKSHYNRFLNQEMIFLTGMPEILVEKASDSKPSHNLAAILLAFSRAGNDKVVHHTLKSFSMPKYQGQYDLGKILVTAAKAMGDANLLNSSLRELIPQVEVRQEFTQAYSVYLAQATLNAAKDGVNASALHQFVAESARVRNRSAKDLYRGWGQVAKIYWKWILSKALMNPKIITDFIDQTVAENRRTFRDTEKYQTVIRESNDLESGTLTRLLYDARSGEYSTVLRAYVAEGKWNLFGKTASETQAKGAVLEDSSGQSYGAKRGEHFVEFTIPKSNGIKIKNLKLKVNESIKLSGEFSDKLSGEFSGGECEGAFTY